MRMMRDWRTWLLAIPAIGAALGIQYLVRHRYPSDASRDAAHAVKPSAFRPIFGPEGPPKGAQPARPAEAVAAKAAKPSRAKPEPAEPETATQEVIDRYASAENSPDEGLGSRKAARGRKARAETAFAPHDPAHDNIGDRTQLTVSAAAPLGKRSVQGAGGSALTPEELVMLNKTGLCSPVEYRGDGPLATRVTKEEWAKVMTQFHGVKGDLLAWLAKNRKGFPDKLQEKMASRIRELKIQRPPTADEPDLAWRGIGAFSHDGEGEPLVRIGSGFVKLIVKQPDRGRFELARLVAQAWAPCELQKLDTDPVWKPLMACLGVNEPSACAVGSYSEGGWAVSSALAAVVSPPGCSVPAFADPTFAACIKKVPLPLNASASASGEVIAASLDTSGN